MKQFLRGGRAVGDLEGWALEDLSLPSDGDGRGQHHG